jgi:hypothetical protein
MVLPRFCGLYHCREQTKTVKDKAVGIGIGGIGIGTDTTGIGTNTGGIGIGIGPTGYR